MQPEAGDFGVVHQTRLVRTIQSQGGEKCANCLIGGLHNTTGIE